MARDDEYMDEIDAPQSDGLGSGLVVITTLVLIAAFILVELALKTYGRGLFAS
jgi:hypothetical protein